MDDRQVPPPAAPDGAVWTAHYQQPLYERATNSFPAQPAVNTNAYPGPSRPPQPPYPAYYPPGQPGCQMPPVYPPYPYSYPPVYPPYYRLPVNGKATAALILGIISLVFAWLGPLSAVGILCSVVGIVLGNIARRELMGGLGRGPATAGLVCSIIGLALSVLMLAGSIVVLTQLAQFGADFGPAYGV